ncbi:Non-motile and phage-resistance protein [compost metagenome]
MPPSPPSYDELLAEVERLRLHHTWVDEDDFHAVFRAAPDMLLLLTPDFRIVESSDARLTATMTTREGTNGRPLFEVFPDNPDNVEAGKDNLKASLRRVLATKEPHEMGLQRYDLMQPDGTFEVRYWKPLNAPVLGPDGEVRYILHRVEDVTDEVLTLDERTRELTAQRDLTWRIIDNAPIGIAFYDQCLVIRYFNRTLARLLGIRAEDVIDKFVGEAFPNLSEDDLERHYGQVLRDGVTYEEKGFALTHRDEHGAERTTYWDFKNLPVRDRNGQIIEIFGMAIEVSERIRNEQLQRERIDTLEQVDRYKDQFLSILSHELRTPINAIMGFGSVVADGLAGALTPDQKRYIGKIMDSSDSLLGLVNDLLDMSRVQAGKFSLDLQTTDLAAVIRNAVAAMFSEAIQKGHSLNNYVPAALPALKADPHRIGQVVSNLVDNAIKYTPDGGTITVRACEHGGMLRVEVCDTGIGIAPEQRSLIFLPFTQVDMSNTRATGGVGLGLSIVKSLVEAHGGEVGVDSEGPNEGSTFWFTLPLLPAEITPLDV